MPIEEALKRNVKGEIGHIRGDVRFISWARLKIIRPPHHKKSELVKSWKEIERDALDMMEFVKKEFTEGFYAGAYAISHSQISNDPKAFFVVNMENGHIKGKFVSAVVINPVIVDADDRTLFKHKEACMSRPHRKESNRMRWHQITVRYLYPWRIPLLGITILRRRKEKVEGLKACIFQHELEHFEGVY